jgi:hypothetical protein
MRNAKIRLKKYAVYSGIGYFPFLICNIFMLALSDEATSSYDYIYIHCTV